jgi:hypothetical protein
MRTTSGLLALFVALGSDRAVAAAPPLGCDPQALRPLLAAGNLLLIGEIHGGVEGPALIAAAACAATRKGLPVAVALEIPYVEGERIDGFLASAGAPADRAALLAGPFWQRPYQDGRSSAAMLELLDALRALAANGAELRVVPFDEPGLDGQVRDDGMARRLVAGVEAGAGGELLIALGGNIHTRTAVGVPWNAAYRPAGVAVETRWPERTVSLLLSAPPGETWMCTDAEAASCGIKSLGGKPIADAGSVEIYAATREGYEGEVRLPASTPSPPAVRAAQ